MCNNLLYYKKFVKRHIFEIYPKNLNLNFPHIALVVSISSINFEKTSTDIRIFYISFLIVHTMSNNLLHQKNFVRHHISEIYHNTSTFSCLAVFLLV